MKSHLAAATGNASMVRYLFGYTRYALSAFGIVAFKVASN